MDEPFHFETVAKDLLDESIARNNCCGNATWRFRLCPYHQGFEDGMDELMTRFAQWMPKPDDA